uniref:CULLIN_2 domain-containing protein n=1 Tax=Heterorhabditis bacteriophora TaxID=37862 RepID=A0A1I7XGB3_HETBA
MTINNIFFTLIFLILATETGSHFTMKPGDPTQNEELHTRTKYNSQEQHINIISLDNSISKMASLLHPVTPLEWQDLFMSVYNMHSWVDQGSDKLHLALDGDIHDYVLQSRDRINQHAGDGDLVIDPDDKILTSGQTYETRHHFTGSSRHGQHRMKTVREEMLNFWKVSAFMPINTQLLSAALKLVEAERNGETFDARLVVGIRESYDLMIFVLFYMVSVFIIFSYIIHTVLSITLFSRLFVNLLMIQPYLKWSSLRDENPNYCDLLLRKTQLSKKLTSEEIDAKLSNLCGMPADHVNKLFRMLQDIEVNKDLNLSFKKTLIGTNNNKTLSGEIVIFGTASGGRFDLDVTTFQMAVLFAWNDRAHEKISFEALRLATELPDTELARTLFSLVCYPKNGKPQNRGRINLIGRLQLSLEPSATKEHEDILALRELRVQEATVRIHRKKRR